MEYYKGSLGLGRRVSTEDKHWEEVTNPDALLGKKVILCLPGNGTKTAKVANGMCKVIANMLSEPVRQALGENIYSVYYSQAKDALLEAGFFNKYLLPFMVKETAYGKSYTEICPDDALPFDEIKKNMRNLTVFTHSQGSQVIAEFEMYFRQGLKKLGYLDAPRSEIMRQMFVLHANDLHQHFGVTKATVMHRISQNDRLETYLADKLGRYMYKHSLDKNLPAAWFTTAENEGVLLFAKTGGDDHNGGFWRKEKMNPLAIKGYDVSGKVLDYVITSDKDMPDIDTIINEALKTDKDLTAFMAEVREKGGQYFAAITSRMQHFDSLQTDFGQKIKKGELKTIAEEILTMSKADSAFFFSQPCNDGLYSIRDYLVQKGDIGQIKLVFETFPDEREPLFDAAVQNDKKEVALELAPCMGEVQKVIPLLHDDINNLPDIIPVIKRIADLDRYRNFRTLLSLFRQSNEMKDEKLKRESQKELSDIILANVYPLLVYRVIQEEDDAYLLSTLQKETSLVIAKGVRENNPDIIDDIIGFAVDDNEIFKHLMSDLDEKSASILVSRVQKKVRETVDWLADKHTGKIRRDDLTVMIGECWSGKVKDMQDMAKHGNEKALQAAKESLINAANKRFFPVTSAVLFYEKDKIGSR